MPSTNPWTQMGRLFPKRPAADDKGNEGEDGEMGGSNVDRDEKQIDENNNDDAKLEEDEEIEQDKIRS